MSQITVAAPEALQEINRLYREVIEDMHRRGFKQWVWGEYPTAEMLADDAAHGRLYRLDDENGLAGAFAACEGQSPEYAALSWHFGVRPCTLHRVALRPDRFGRGYGRQITQFAMDAGRERGCDCFRVDTSSENERALKLFSGMTERYVGDVFFPDHGEPFRAFEKRLTEDCPLLPMRMRPAYRYGDMTPWGGDGLRRAFGLEIPDERTGEALVISAIPQLESRDDADETLTELIARYGEKLVGAKNVETFPLLLKLIAAREQLSVQVHPDDAYAAEHEHKLGKSEAWVILHAEEGARILYGLKSQTNTELLRNVLDAGGDIEPLIESVPVHAGDVFYMPSGMVHAIGGGIVLYEIQQSSDVTYRLWDYNRTNAKGEKRPLHLKQALDVIRPALRGQRAALTDEPGFHRLLDVPAFTLDCLTLQGELPIRPNAGGFRMLTALGGLTLQWDGDALELHAGESVLLPACCPPVTLVGVGKALMSSSK